MEQEEIKIFKSPRIMKNFPIEYHGNVYWRSRSVALAGFVFCNDKDGKLCVLANKRGPGCPDEIGKWCAPCGYLDFNEDGQEGVTREIFEETGVKILPSEMIYQSINFSREKDQNVTVRYYKLLDGVIDDYPLSNANNEDGETTDIQWIILKDMDKYDWAFDHNKIIKLIALANLGVL